MIVHGKFLKIKWNKVNLKNNSTLEKPRKKFLNLNVLFIFHFIQEKGSEINIHNYC